MNPDHLTKCTYDTFVKGNHADYSEVISFYQWVKSLKKSGLYAFENVRLKAQETETQIRNHQNRIVNLINLSSYNYLGYSNHPEVITAAKHALDLYGLGACSSPVISGTLGIHQQFEQALLQFFSLPNRGVSLFSSGYGVNVGTISALMKPGSYILLDQNAHTSILEGAKLSGAKVIFYRHNNMAHLEFLLSKIADRPQRKLICTEGLFSVHGDQGKIHSIVKIAKSFGAQTLVDEVHSALLTGLHSKGMCAEQKALDEVDFIILTFSKGFGGVGGALIAKKEIACYVNLYARCRLFSCALNPAVVGGMLKSLELDSGKDGDAKRERLNYLSAFILEKSVERGFIAQDIGFTVL